MPHNDTIALSGTIQHVFAHRFTVEADGDIHLADLGPKGAGAFPLRAGAHVDIEGERRPSEIKVTRIAGDVGEPIEIHHKKPHHAPGHVHPDLPADSIGTLAAVHKAGWNALGDPLRKPKHFEVLARQGVGPWSELHVDFGGTIYKQKAADPAKWAVIA